MEVVTRLLPRSRLRHSRHDVTHFWTASPGSSPSRACSSSASARGSGRLDALEAACWGAQLRSDASICTPGFTGGTAHFKNKFCPACKTGTFEIPLAHIRAMPQRTQITRHDCVEGWSAIGEWTGPQLSLLLDEAGLQENARFILFRCADNLNGQDYYESIDLIDAYHPQTIIAHSLNGEPLPIRNGAPLRMRIERQLGYKHAKYLTAIEAVASLDDIGLGQGGYWEDRAGYQWYAGI